MSEKRLRLFIHSATGKQGSTTGTFIEPAHPREHFRREIQRKVPWYQVAIVAARWAGERDI